MRIESLKRYKKPSHRKARMEHMIQEVVSELLLRGKIKDRTLVSSPITVTYVRCSEDLKYADVYVSELNTRVPSTTEKQVLMKGFKRAQAYISSEVNKHIHKYRGPELRFKIDDELYRGEHLVDLISETCGASQTSKELS